MKKYPCVYMRGGTSKAIFFQEKDLPRDKKLWDEIFLKVMGSPDVKQIDGMGGSISTTSKIAVISISEREDADVDYNYFQVDIKIPRVDNHSNCGNISSAVGPYAIDEGLVNPIEPLTVVRIFNTNTQKIIEEHIRVKDGKAMVYGDEMIKGVPGTGSRIDMYFENPAGAVTGKLFPTGNKRDFFDIPGHKKVEVTVIDSANPVIFIKAEDLELQGIELTEINTNEKLLENIEKLRGIIAEKLGFVSKWQDASKISTAVPKISIISQPQTYIDLDNNEVKKENMDICCRAISVGSLHKAYPMTVAIATGSAARIKGTIVNEIINFSENQEIVRIGHTSGITNVDIKTEGEKILKGGVVRTARRIMEGHVYIRD